MKKGLLFALMAVALIACKDNKKLLQQTSTEEQTRTEMVQGTTFDWLLGNWRRTNDKAGRSTFESWSKIKDNQYDGIGYTLVQDDTLSKEHMKLQQINGKWSLIVKTADDAELVEFKMTELKENSFVCVNETHDFPTHIAYQLNGDKLQAKVSNKDMAIDFEFVKE
ncbi:DUF6265 family protein [Myroides sp. DW712]|uniref:DUF6265 family protein n=1 Tax=Myroides sp. DW712 TaxID=3389800 RepID=UPI0039786BC9